MNSTYILIYVLTYLGNTVPSGSAGTGPEKYSSNAWEAHTSWATIAAKSVSAESLFLSL